MAKTFPFPTELALVRDNAYLVNNWYVVDPRNGHKFNYYGFATKEDAIREYEALLDPCKFDGDGILKLED